MLTTHQLTFAAGAKIIGTVTDARTKEPLAGVSVFIEHTGLGAPTNLLGEYSILNVPLGVYNIRASAVGYRVEIKKNVQVAGAEVVTADFALEAIDIEMEDVIGYAPVVDLSRTSPKSTFTRDDVGALPLRSLESAIAAVPGVYKGFIRGGRQYETKTLVDGIDVTDQFYAAAAEQISVSPYQAYNGVTRQLQASGSSLTHLNISSVDEATVFAGSTSSELSGATAGVVAYTLHDAPNTWTARVNLNISQTHLNHIGPRIYNDDTVYARERQQFLSGHTAADSLRARRYSYIPGKYNYAGSPTSELEVALGGQLFDAAGVYLTSRYFNSRGRLPNEFVRRINSTLKLNYQVNANTFVTATGLLEDRGRIFGWKNRDYADEFRYFLEGVPTWDGVNVVAGVKLTQYLSKNTFYEVQASFVRDLARRGFSDDNNDGRVSPGEDGDFLTFETAAEVNRYMSSDVNRFFSPSPANEGGNTTTLGGSVNWKLDRPGIFYERFVNSVFTVKGDIAGQITDAHLLKAGLQVRAHDLGRTLRASFVGGTFPSYKNYVEEIWNVKPKEYGVYAEDRMQFEGLMLNIGFRLDALDIAGGDYANYFAPFRIDTTYSNGVITDVRRVPVRREDAVTKYFFSPRLGVSHPISEKAAMYFSFSHQQQSQPFSRLYANYNDFGNPSLPVVTRTNQDPIRSTNYDLGIQWAFADEYGLDLNAYYKDTENLGSLMFSVTPNAPWKTYNISTAFGYADSRGVELTLRKNQSPLADFLGFSGRISYAYSYVKQAVSAGGNVTSFSTASDSVRYGGQLPFDEIRSFNTIERNVLGGNSTLTGGYDRTHRFGFNLFFHFPYDISLSSVGLFQSGFFYTLAFGDPRARELGVSSWNKRVDLRIEKAFTIEKVARFALYVDIMNAFNWTNILAYNVSTQGQEAWEKHGDPTGGPSINRAVTQDGSMVYDTPREIYFGVTIIF